MRANGTLTQATLGSYKAFGTEMQRLTKTDDDAAAGLLQVAESYGVSGDAAERAARNAIAMEAALGVDRDAAIKMTAALEQGNTTLLSRYLPALRGIKDPADKAAAAQAALAKMFGVAEAEAQTYAGASAQLGNAVGDLQESFGEVLAQGLTPLMKRPRHGRGFNELDASTKSVITYTGRLLRMAGLATPPAAIAVTSAGDLVRHADRHGYRSGRRSASTRRSGRATWWHAAGRQRGCCSRCTSGRPRPKRTPRCLAI